MTGLRLAVLAGTAAVVAVSLAGDLNPPAGPAGPTMKTLSEVEPRIAVNAVNTPGDATNSFIISQPGSYYLAGNISGAAGKNGILLATTDASLDLSGFVLEGVPGSLEGVSGGGGNASRSSVVNGVVRNWGSVGVQLAAGDNVQLRDLRLTGNGSNGATVRNGSSITRCVFGSNSAHGLSTGSGNTIVACTSHANASSGFIVGGDCTFSQCTSTNNGGSGIVTGPGSHVAHCISNANTGDGIRAVSDTVIMANICASNGLSAGNGAGIHVTSSDNRIEGNNVTDSDRGIDVDVAGNLIIRNSASGNTTNYDVVAGNFGNYVSAPSSVAVSGAAGGTAIGSVAGADAWANLSY